MANTAGRNFLVKKNDVTIAGFQTVGMKVNGEPISVMTQTSDGIEVYLDDVFIGQSIEISVEGLFDTDMLRALSLGATSGVFLNDISVAFADGATLTGNFIFKDYEENGEQDEATKVSGMFISNGAYAYTAA